MIFYLPFFMRRRLFVLIGLCLLLGVVTRAFGAEQKLAPWITREGAVAMLVESKPEWRRELESVRASLPPMPIYTDTDQDAWYIPYLEVAFNHNLIVANDFRREFHPGELLRQSDAITLAVRYAAHGDASVLPHEEPDHPLFNALHLQLAYDKGLTLPSPLQEWNVIRRSAWLDLIESAGVQNPGAITIVIPPKVVPIPAQPTPALPVTGPLDPLSVPPVQAQPVMPPPQVTTGTKPSDPALQAIFAPLQYPTVTARPAVSQPVAAAPSYVPNPPGSRPVSSDDRGTVTSTSTSTTPAANGKFAISIPSLGMTDLTITHPSDVTTQAGLLAPLQVGVGHLFGYPGNGGTILVYGHSSSYSWDVSQYTKIFRQINKLKPGDRVTITYGGKVYTYEVTFSQTVDAADMSAYQQNNGEELILYTCWPPDDVKQRYLVHAKPV